MQAKKAIYLFQSDLKFFDTINSQLNIVEACKKCLDIPSNGQASFNADEISPNQQASIIMDYNSEMSQVIGIENVFSLSQLLSQDQESLLKHLSEVFQKVILDNTCEQWSKQSIPSPANWDISLLEVHSLNKQMENLVAQTKLSYQKFLLRANDSNAEVVLKKYSRRLQSLTSENQFLRTELSASHFRENSQSPPRNISSMIENLTPTNQNQMFNGLNQSSNLGLGFSNLDLNQSDEIQKLTKINHKQERALKSYESA